MLLEEVEAKQMHVAVIVPYLKKPPVADYTTETFLVVSGTEYPKHVVRPFSSYEQLI